MYDTKLPKQAFHIHQEEEEILAILEEDGKLKPKQ
jgi:hypothetical protein